jgi:DNA-binding transcriptional LysR family regulator
MGIDTDDMTVFLAVVQEGSFGRAASSLMMSQPSVSERVARLERRLGAGLFTRGARGTVLTPAGEQLVPYARRALDLFDEAVQSVRDGDGPTALRVGVHATFAHRAIPLLLDALGDLQRRVIVRDAHSDQVVAMLLDGVIDVGFILPGARPRPLRFMALPADPVVTVCAPSHPLAGRTVGLKALVGFRVALNRWGTGASEFLARVEGAGVPEWQITECSDGHTALTLARNHGHIAFVTSSITSHDVATGGLALLSLRPSPRWSVPLTFAFRSTDDREPVIGALRSALVGRRS